MWLRVGPFLVIMFFVLLSDAILADFVPGYVQGIVGTPLLMGIVMATSSVVGFGVDLLFPQLLRNTGVGKLVIMAIIGASLFLSTLFVSTWMPYVWILIIGMAAWGVYYELDAFMTRQFVADAAQPHARSAVWGVVGTFRNLAYFLGPLIGAKIAFAGERGVIMAAGVVLVVAYLAFLWVKLPGSKGDESVHGVDVLAEIRHWVSLGVHAWPVLIMSFLIGVIDASFWTTGTVVNDMLALESPYGGWFLSLYMLPSLFIGFVIAKWGIYQGKKRWAEIFLILGGAILAMIGVVQSIWWILGTVVLSSIFIGLAWPLIDAVYSDLTVRMVRRGRKHMMGMSNAMHSLSYVIGPIIAGALAGEFGELESFGYIGAIVMIVSIILLFVTPKKIRLPQQEINAWDKPW